MQSFFRTAVYGTQHSKVVFMLTGWGNTIWMYRGFAAMLVAGGYRVIVYEYDAGVLSPDADKTVRCLTAIRDDVLKQISSLKSEGCRDFAVFGVSLGSVIALMAADHSPDISRVILNTTGSDVAETVWGWDSFQPAFKRELAKLHRTLEHLKQLWKPIAPSNNIGNLQGKKILVYLARHDEIIPYPLGAALVKQLQQRGYDCTVRINPILGHILTATVNLVNSRVYLTFLREK